MFTSTIPVQATQCMGTYTVTRGGRWFEGAQQLLLVTLNCCIGKSLVLVQCTIVQCMKRVVWHQCAITILSILGRTTTSREFDIIVISAATTMMSSCTRDGPVIDIR